MAVEQSADRLAIPPTMTPPAAGRGRRLRLLAAAVLAGAAAHVLARLLDVPQAPGFAGSLLAEPGVGVALAAVVTAVLAAAAFGTAFAGSAYEDAGVFAAAVALATFAVRGGPIGPVLRQAGPGAYRLLLPELLLLWAVLLAAWLVARQFTAGRSRPGDPPATRVSIGQKSLALAVQAVVTALLMSLLARSPAKKQALASLAVAGFFASLAAHHLLPAVRGSAWFWGGPLLAGAAGYAYAMSSPGQPLLGLPANPLASPVPLDYASLGVAGSLVGYWVSRRWHHERAAENG